MTTLLAVLLILQAQPGSGHEEAPRPRVPLYTNEDLDRVHSLRHETGVASVPAAAPATPRERARPRGSARVRGEEYWRREAARVRDRVAALLAQAEELRAILAEREARRRDTPGGSRAGDTSDGRLKARLAGIERHIHRLEDELRERARRQGALPGWLR